MTDVAERIQPLLASARPRVRFAGVTDRGRVRARNEDSFLTAPPCFVVADGMGGHDGGQMASLVAVTSFLALAGRDHVTPGEVQGALSRAARAVNHLPGRGRPPGTTLAGAAMTSVEGQDCWMVFNVGDSRVYLHRYGELTQITRDHSAHLELPGNWRRGIITRALGAGMGRAPIIDQWLLPLLAGDRLLICSDGLHAELDGDCLDEVMAGPLSPECKAKRLVTEAIDAGGRDNVTAVVVETA